jgi:LCP family protein required for cell wall assembly
VSTTLPATMTPFTTRALRADQTPQKKRIPWATAAVAVATFGRALFGWYGAWKAEKKEEQRFSRARAIFKKVAVVLIAILIALGLLAGVVKALVATNVLNLQTVFSVAGKDLPTDANGFTNFLLVGKGDEGHEGVDLMDTIMIASMDAKKTKSAVLLSIPRDLYLLKTENMGRGRINDRYREYKAQLIHKGIAEEEAETEALKEFGFEVGRQFGIDIHRIVVMDFIGFVKVVDALGGVDIVVPSDLVDTQYPGPNYTYTTFRISAGPQHLDGETALKYARSRHSTSDFDRSARQQQIISALADKARAGGILSSPSKLMELWQIASDHSQTTMDMGELIGAAALGDKINRDRLITMQLNNGHGYDTGIAWAGGFLYSPPRDEFGGASVLLPVSIPEFPVTNKQLQVFTKLLTQHRSIYIAKPSVSILNATKKNGLARAIATEFARYDFPIAIIGNLPNKEERDTSSVIPRTEDDIAAATFYGSLLGMPVGEPLPAGEPAPEEYGNVTIVLGKDYEYKLLQDLVPLP